MFNVIKDQQTPRVEFWEHEYIGMKQGILQSLLEFAQTYEEMTLAGLAANQVRFTGGCVRERLMIPACFIKQENDPWIVAVNPEIVERTGEPYESYEGCATWPEKVIVAQRHPDIYVQWHDIEGASCSTRFTGFESKVWQHEVDHLLGVQELILTQLEARQRRNRIVMRDKPKLGRNEPCACQSGKKFKKCCLNR